MKKVSSLFCSLLACILVLLATSAVANPRNGSPPAYATVDTSAHFLASSLLAPVDLLAPTLVYEPDWPAATSTTTTAAQFLSRVSYYLDRKTAELPTLPRDGPQHYTALTDAITFDQGTSDLALNNAGLAHIEVVLTDNAATSYDQLGSAVDFQTGLMLPAPGD